MKIVVFGATGATGKNVVECALAKGHEVIAVARKPEAIAPRERLTVRQGDVLRPDAVAAAIAGADAVISAIGPANNKEPGTLISDGINNIVFAAARANVQRVVFESGLMMSDGRELSFVGRIGLAVYRALNRKLHDDKAKAETYLEGSNLHWVIVRPPALDHSPATGRYIAGVRARVNPAKKLSHADAADFLVRAATEPEWSRKTVNVGH